MILTTLLAAGNLTLWGMALVLIWTAFLRLSDMTHLALAARGRVPNKRDPMPPMILPSARMFAITSLAAGGAAFIAFMSISGVVPNIHPLVLMLRLVLAQGVLMFFLFVVSPHPMWKIVWVIAWGLFCLILKFLC